MRFNTDSRFSKGDFFGPFKLGSGRIFSGYDYHKVPFPFDIRIKRAFVKAFSNAVGENAVIELRNDVNGKGDVLAVTVKVGENTGNNTGNLVITMDKYLVFRVKTDAQLSDVDVYFWG